SRTCPAASRVICKRSAAIVAAFALLMAFLHPSRTKRDEARAWLALSLVEGLPPHQARPLAERFGGPLALLEASPGALVAAGVSAEVAADLARASARAARELDALAAAGATLVAWSDAAYPVRLRSIAEPPLALALRGTLAPEDDLAVA